jgi:hypothetical protein
MHLPSTRYHRELPPRIIHTPEEHDELEADGWADTPAAFDDPEDDEGDAPATPATDDATDDAADDDAREDVNREAAAAPAAKTTIAAKRKR